MENIDKIIKEKLERLTPPNYEQKQVINTINFVQSRQQKSISFWKYLLPFIGVGLFALGYNLGSKKITLDEIMSFSKHSQIAKAQSNDSNNTSLNEGVNEDRTTSLNNKDQNLDIITQDNAKQYKLSGSNTFLQNKREISHLTKNFTKSHQIHLPVSDIPNFVTSLNDDGYRNSDLSTETHIINDDTSIQDQSSQFSSSQLASNGALSTARYGLFDVNFLPSRTYSLVNSIQSQQLIKPKIEILKHNKNQPSILISINSDHNHIFTSIEYSKNIWNGLYLNAGIGYGTSLKSKFENTFEYNIFFGSNFYEDYHIPSSASNISDIEIKTSFASVPIRLGYRYVMYPRFSIYSQLSMLGVIKIKDFAEYKFSESVQKNDQDKKEYLLPSAELGVSYNFTKSTFLSIFGGIKGLSPNKQRSDHHNFSPIIGFSLGCKI
jgi:hypothetical protein